MKKDLIIIYLFERYKIDFIIQEKILWKNDNKISVRFSTRNLDMNGKILNVPIFIAEYIDKLIQIEEQNNGGRKNF